MQKDEIAHYFRISECNNLLRVCISNTNLNARTSRFSVHIEKQTEDSTWHTVEGTLRGHFWTYDDAERLAKGMYKTLALKGPDVVGSDDLAKILF